MEITRQGSRLLFIAVAAALISIVLTDVASAAFPGRPGLIAFERRIGASGGSEIWVSRGRNKPQRRLTRNDAYDADPAFSPNGRLIAFTRNFEIWVMRPDGSGQRQVTSLSPDVDPEESREATEPAFSANGRWIAFSLLISQPDQQFDRIARVNLNGSGVRVLTWGTSPALSPNGKIMAIRRDDAIFTARVDGSRARPLAEGYDPDFSPNGRWIVYGSRAKCPNGRTFGSGLFAKSPSRSRTRRVVRRCGQGLLNPAFSPNGGVVVFQIGDEGSVAPRPRLDETLFNGGRLPFGGAPRDRGFRDSDPSWQPLPRGR